MKTIKLSQNKLATVDDDDYELLNKHKWYAVRNGHHFYAKRVVYTNGQRKNILMHRMIIGAKSGEIVDHINQNGLDNRKKNLRIVSQGENIRNTRHSKGSTGYFGVWKRKTYKKFTAALYPKGRETKALIVGNYYTAFEAAKAYDEKCIELGLLDKLNFPASKNCE